MESNEMLLQTNLLNKLHESGYAINVDIDMWRPDREWIDYLFSLKDFTIRENPPNICSFDSNLQTDHNRTVSITAFCRPEDADYLATKIKQRKEVNK